MQLTKEQIQKIDTFLKEINIVYDDIRFEMVDHIASEIEEKVADIPTFFAYNKLETPFLRYMMSKKEVFIKSYNVQRKKAFKNTFLKIISDSKELLLTPKKLFFVLLISGLILFFGRTYFEVATKILATVSYVSFLGFIYLIGKRNTFKKVKVQLSVLNMYFLLLAIVSSQFITYLFSVFYLKFREISIFDFYLVFTCCVLQVFISNSLYKNHLNILKKYQFIQQS